jgi:NTE family protein
MAKAKRINLALQGGGAHGAFTWGVLDRLLESDEIEIAGISGTSAGALNGAALKAGLARGGPEAARENLAWLWEQVGAITDPRITPWLEAVAPVAVSHWIETSLPFAIGDAVSRMVSPYSYGPFFGNPLTPIVDKFHYEQICCAEGPGLLRLCHHRAHRQDPGVRRAMTSRRSPASGLRLLAHPVHQAVEVDDPKTGATRGLLGRRLYRQPGAVSALPNRICPDDVLIININPLMRHDVPVTSAPEIQNRVNEVSFNSSLLQRACGLSDFVQRLLHDGAVQPGSMKEVRVHMIADDALMNELSVATKLVATPQVLHQLQVAGRAAAEAFLDAHLGAIGTDSSVDLRMMFG